MEVKTATLTDLTEWVIEKATAYASLHGVEPTQPELDALFGTFSPRRWRWWLSRPPDYQESLLRAWLEGARRMRGGSHPPADGDPVMLAVRLLGKIEDIAAGTAAAILAMRREEK